MFDQEGHLTDEAMEAFALGRLSELEEARFRQHMEACKDCRFVHEMSVRFADEVADEFERIWCEMFPGDNAGTDADRKRLLNAYQNLFREGGKLTTADFRRALGLDDD